MNGFRLFTLARIPVHTDWFFLVFIAFLALLWGPAGIPLIVLLFGSVIFHEYGHALTGRYLYGSECHGIYLLPFGGMALIDGDALDEPEKEAMVALAGPLASILLAVASFVLFALTGSYLLGMLAIINLLLGVFNLLPIYPMDGGRILKAGFWWYYEDQQEATKKVSGMSFIFAAVLGVVCLAAGYIWIAILMAFVAYLNYHEVGHGK